MKTTNRLLLAVSLFAAPALFAAGGGQASAYEQAVNSYIDGATQQMRAIRTDVDASVGSAGDTGKRAFAEAYRGLDHCDALIAQLRVAVPRDFDLVKARFEAARADTVIKIASARKTLP